MMAKIAPIVPYQWAFTFPPPSSILISIKNVIHIFVIEYRLKFLKNSAAFSFAKLTEFRQQKLEIIKIKYSKMK